MRNKMWIRAAALTAAISACGSVARGTPVLTTLVTFDGAGNGSEPLSGLTADSAGNLYGTTTQENFGSGIANGTVYELPVTNYSAITTLATFNNSNGSRPQGSLAIDSAGDLFGTTGQGGTALDGTVFAVRAGSGTITDLTDFVGTNGSYPDGGLALHDGILYGTTSAAGNTGGGSLFTIPSSGGSAETTLIRFPAGSEPAGRLVVDSAGDIFGTTTGIGTGGSGTVWEVPASTGSLVPLATFNGSNGSIPGDLTADSAGNLYGTTKSGGLYGYGTVYEIQASSDTTITTLANFNGLNGATSTAGVLVDAAGNLFGTASSGGSSNIFGQETGDGSIFEVAAGSGTITELAAFNGSNGADPHAGLYADSNGDLFGTTDSGGNSSDGTIFELTGSGFVISAPQPVNVASGQTYHFTVNPGTGILVRNVSTLTIANGGTAIVDMATNHANRQLLDVTTISLAGTTGAWTGKLDLTNNDMDLATGSLAIVTDQIRQGYNNGKWNGSGGIASSAAAADASHLTALGVIQNNQGGTALFTASNLFDGTVPGVGDILVKYTYYGDANLDGKVDGSDYSLIDAAYVADKSNPTALTGWFNGDFNYDGTVNGSDYTLMDNAFNMQGTVLSAAVASPTAQMAGAAGTSAVPEPAAFALVGIGSLAALSRRGIRRA